MRAEKLKEKLIKKEITTQQYLKRMSKKLGRLNDFE